MIPDICRLSVVVYFLVYLTFAESIVNRRGTIWTRDTFDINVNKRAVLCSSSGWESSSWVTMLITTAAHSPQPPRRQLILQFWDLHTESRFTQLWINGLIVTLGFAAASGSCGLSPAAGLYLLWLNYCRSLFAVSQVKLEPASPQAKPTAHLDPALHWSETDQINVSYISIYTIWECRADSPDIQSVHSHLKFRVMCRTVNRQITYSIRFTLYTGKYKWPD